MMASSPVKKIARTGPGAAFTLHDLLRISTFLSKIEEVRVFSLTKDTFEWVLGTDLDLGDVPLTAEQLTQIRTRRVVGVSIKRPEQGSAINAAELRVLLGNITGIGPTKPVVNLFSGTPHGDSSLLNLRRFACSHLAGSFADFFLAEPPLSGLRSIDLTHKDSGTEMASCTSDQQCWRLCEIAAAYRSCLQWQL
jgi:hypothetical protein